MQFDASSTEGEPVSIEQVRASVQELVAANRSGEAIEMMIQMVTFLRQENTALSLKLAKQLKARFGQSSEKLSTSQLSLFLGILGADDEEPEPSEPEDEGTGDEQLDKHFAKKAAAKKGKKPSGRRPLPEHLPREKVLIPVPDAKRECPSCGTERRCIGHDTSEVLEWTPGMFKVLVFEREKLACKPCQGEISVAPVADKVIEGGLPGPGLLTELILKKYKYAQPLWRQAHYFATRGVRLAESTMCGWIKAGAELLEPIYDEIVRLVLGSHCINTDDSHLKVLDREHPNGIKRGSMWVYIGDQLHVFFDYTASRSREGPDRILGGFIGKIQADAYSAYDHLFVGEAATAIEIACMMHARRYFVEALEAGELGAARPLKLVKKLYKIEEYAKDIGASPSKRCTIRQEKSKPVMDELGRLLAEQSKLAVEGTLLHAAIGYAVRQWDALSQFLDDGRIEIDNGLAERVIRTLAIGRKNYLFAGSHAAAQRSAILYSLIASCDLANVDTGAYLSDVMMKIASGWPQSRIAELVPANWAELRAPSLQRAA